MTLNLKGHTLTGTGGGSGILASNVSRVNIVGPGTVTNFQLGVVFEHVRDSVIEKVSANDNVIGIGLLDSSGNEIQENEANGNDSVGIRLQESSNDNEIEENETNGNGVGIQLRNLALNNEVEENTALNNSAFDLEDQNSNCDDNEWEDNTFVTASQPCIE